MAISASTGITTHGQRSGIAGAAVELASKVVLLDAFLFSLFLFDRRFVAGVPLGAALSVLIFLIGLNRKPSVRIPKLGWIGPALGLMIIYLAVISETNGLDWYERGLKILGLVLLLWVLVEGRIDTLSAVAGLSVAAIVNTVAHYTWLGKAGAGVLTGYWGEKNYAGMWYAIVLILGLIWIRTRPRQLLWVMFGAASLFLTGSRTSMSAFAAALVWVFFRNRTDVFFRVILAGGMMWGLDYAEENLARIGVFADRDGTDMLRDRIDRAANAKTEAASWFGEGLGEAYVWMQDRTWFFHDSYAALRVEGGWPLAIFWVGLIVFVGIAIHKSGDVNYETVIGEAALVALMVCAWQLGEVFFATTGFISLGVALRVRYGEPIEEQSEWKRLKSKYQGAA